MRGGRRESARVIAATAALTALLLIVLSLPAPARAWASGRALARRATGELLLRGPEANNTFLIRATGTDRGTYSVDGARPTRFSGIRSLTMDGVGGHDVCRIVNPRHGLFAPPSGISCNGGNSPGRPRRGVLEIVGGRGTSESYTPGRPGAGTITHRIGHTSQVIRFTGMAPVIDTVSEPSLMFTEPSANDTVQLVNGPPGELTIQSANSDFESITFSNKTNVTINATESGDQGLLDTTQSATGLSTLTFNTDSNITSDEADLSGVSVNLNSSNGDIAQGSGGTLIAANVALSAANGIGSTSQPLDLGGAVNLAFANTGGAVDISSEGALTIAEAGSLTSSSNTGTTTTLSATDPLVFAADTTSAGSLSATTAPELDDDITVNSDVTVESTGGDVSLTSGRNVVTQSSSLVKSDTGNVTLTDGVDNGGAFILHGSLQAPEGTVTPGYPSASIAAPVNGTYYGVDQTIMSSFTCTEGSGGPGISTCLDQNGNPSGTAIDTSTVGSHTFTVTATSDDYLSGTSSVTYNVAAPPSVSITSPANGATYALGQVVNSSFSCVDGSGGTGIASCVDGNGNPSGSAVDTSVPGQHSFSVTATSNDGLTGSATVTYTVTPAPSGTTTIPATPSGPTNPSGPTKASGTPSGTSTPSGAAASAPNGPAELSDFKVTPHAFRAATGGTAVVSEIATGAAITYRDSLAADTTLRVYRELPGVMRGRRCVRASRHQPRGKRKQCTRLVIVGSFKHQDLVGTNRLRFTGRVAHHALSPGSYTLKATAKLAGQVSRTDRTSFVILPPAA